MAAPVLHTLRGCRGAVASVRLAATSAGAPLRPLAVQSRTFAFTPASHEHARTGLYDFHIKNGGKMVPFAGYDMPLSYGNVGQGEWCIASGSRVARSHHLHAVTSHNHVRNECGLFDVGHMVQHRFEGPGALTFLESLVPTSLSTLEPFSSSLSVLLNDQGGIIDDLILSKQDDSEHWYVVTNAGRRDEDLTHIADKLRAWTGGKVEHQIMDGWGLVALQGPSAVKVLAKHTDADLNNLTFGRSVKASVAGAECHIARAGYTGEDGFEISIPPAETEAVTQALLDTSPTQLAGLAARDSLRLEAGMCLYGHDLDESISPVEAALSWLISKPRRAQADFPGAQRILQELKEGPKRRRVGLVIEGAPARGEWVWQLPPSQGCKAAQRDG